MKSELQLFYTAVSFYTRIPLHDQFQFNRELLLPSIKYLPVIGYLIGIFSSLAFSISFLLFNENIAIIMGILASVLITGGFHEDGLADACDGFGGGWTKDKILEIMKDSRIGTYGILGLLTVFSLKYLTIFDLKSVYHNWLTGTLLLFIAPAAVSRFFPILIIYRLTYARKEDSKSENAVGTLSANQLIFPLIFTLLPLILLSLITMQGAFVLILIPLYFMTTFCGSYFKKWIDGYTGDCLGAVQQITEVVTYLLFVLIWKFTL